VAGRNTNIIMFLEWQVEISKCYKLHVLKSQLVSYIKQTTTQHLAVSKSPGLSGFITLCQPFPVTATMKASWYALARV